MAVATTLAITAAVGGITSMVGAQVKKNEAKKQMEAEAKKANDAKTALEEIEKNRQEVINPYENMANEFENLGVATQASKFQAEEADIALANTLDTIMQTGGGAGGATALAQAALQSKKGVSANIEQQEAQNEKLRAQGESQLERLQMQEAQRVQSIGMSEAQRLQQADIAGKTFMFENRERRQTEQLNRKQAQITNQAQAAVAASQGASALYSAGMSSFGNIAAAYAGNTGIANVELDRDGDPSTPY